MDEALFTGIERIVAGYPAGVALFETGFDASAEAWIVTVRPTRLGPAAFSLSHDGDDIVRVLIDRTFFEVFSIKDPADLGHLWPVIHGVLDGNFEQAGIGEGFGRLRLPGNASASVGRLHFPWPWALRPFRQRFPGYARGQ